MYPKGSEYEDLPELASIIDTRITYHFDYDNPDLKVSDNTLSQAKLKKDFLVTYGFADHKRELTNFNINSFKQIGLTDPFPDDCK